MPPDLAPADPFGLLAARVHEAQGRGRRAFALFQAARHAGPLVWIMPGHRSELPMLRGLPIGVGERLHLFCPTRESDLLWCIEEALRSRAVGLVIAEPEQPLSLIAGRRLQLAAEAGHTTGLLLIHEGEGSPATETRWACAPLAASSGDSTLHQWDLKKNKKGTYGVWTVDWNGTSSAFDMVCPARERCEPAQAAR